MQVHIHAPWEVNEFIDQTIRDKVENLATYYNRIERIDVYLSMGDTHMPHAKIIKIRVAVPKNDLFAEEHSDSFEKSITKIVHKLQKQLKKHKEKLARLR